MSKDQPITTWALVGTTALGAAGWVTSTLRDRRTADSVIVTAATELVDRLTTEINRLRTDMAEVRAEALTAKAEAVSVRLQVEACEERHAQVATQLALLEARTDRRHP